ncbi:DEAD/DEAH box helicase [Winogradskyella sediminis]|uniref:DEAD/DEAH box helicase n=1 Tax=Winogradskyella sediminis TaxID=1382466 RepID=A0A1H1P3G3_9FLAO|nr:DEAD/DEAH box helicase [Winogradskyella sediminis]REG90172.1 RAD3-like DEAD/DEAH box helicase [Winogradskyella sediminis]SDS05570.1 DEAD/DEAH box helicase [Winogradskyella sediminis]
MSFKKLHPLLKESLENAGFETSNAFQKKVLPILKGGSDAYVLAPKGSGKTTALIIATIHKLKAQAFEDSPRAIIVVKDKIDALALKEEFEKFTKNTDLRVYALYDEYDIEKQKNEVYFGQDIVIASPARLSKLYFLNGIHLGEVQLFAIEDADYLGRNNAYNLILRLSESLSKCQFIINADEMYSKIKNYQHNFMSNAHIVAKKK